MSAMEPMTPVDVTVRKSPNSDSVYTILLVDDDKLGRMVAKRRLTKLNYRILEAGNGMEALGLLEREFVDLVLSDWMMPEMDGPATM